MDTLLSKAEHAWSYLFSSKQKKSFANKPGSQWSSRDRVILNSANEINDTNTFHAHEDTALWLPLSFHKITSFDSVRLAGKAAMKTK